MRKLESCHPTLNYSVESLDKMEGTAETVGYSSTKDLLLGEM